MKNIKNNEKEKVEFVGTVVRCTYNTPNYKIYAVDVDKEQFPNIKFTIYGSATITGELHELGEGVKYKIIATEENHPKYGYSYHVLNIQRNRPKNKEDMYFFLQEILTCKQAETLYNAYPDIVDKVMNNDLNDIDLSKLDGIKEYTFNCIKNKIIENFCLSEIVNEFQGYFSLTVVRKLYERYSSVTMIKTKIKEEPYKCLCNLSGIGFKTADNILLDIQKISDDNIKNGKPPIIDFGYDIKTSKQRCLACMMYLLEENEKNGNTNMNIVDLKHECDTLCPSCSNYFVECAKCDEINYDKNNLLISLKSTYDTEKYIADKMIEGIHQTNVWNIDNIEKYRYVNDNKLTDEQISMLNNVCKHTITILNGSAGCVDCDTEFFNGTEWKKISEFKDGEKVLQYNEDGTAELVYPNEYFKQKADILYHFSTKYGCDQCLSLNHTVPYITSRGNIKKRLFSEIKDMQENKGFTGRFITSFNYNGTKIKLTDDEIRLMIAIFADGSFYSKSKKYNDSYNTVRFHLKKKRKKERLVSILDSLNIKYSHKTSTAKGYDDYYFEAPFRAKSFPKEWYNCSNHQFYVIANEVMNWDGDYYKQNCYCTTNKEDADFIQFVYSSLGFRAIISINNKMGRKRIINNKEYDTKTIDYTVSYTKRNLIGMCCDNRINHNKIEITPYKTKDGYEYCFNVPSHLLVLRRNDRIFITGNCGKSMSVKGLINMLEDNNKSYKLMTPTGKSSKVLNDFTKKQAMTIHRGLGFIPPSTWSYNKDYQFNVDIIIVDEFSMVDIFLMKHLVEAIDFSKTKLLLIGDNAQLPSVGAGNLLHDFMQSKIFTTVLLTKVFRYSDGGLMKVATDVRNCKKYLKNINSTFTYFGENKDYAFINTTSDIMADTTIALYKKLLDKGYKTEDIQVLIAKKVGDCGTIEINNRLQKIANINYGSNNCMAFKDVKYYKDDIVIQTSNNYHAEIYFGYDDVEFDKTMKEVFVANGETGKILEANQSYMIIDFDSVKVKYYRNDVQTINLGYAITIHKSQGSSSKVIILVTPKSHSFMLNSNLIYVGLTRMKEKCFHLGEAKNIDMCIMKKENLKRNTYMQKLLKNK